MIPLPSVAAQQAPFERGECVVEAVADLSMLYVVAAKH
jgi:hypothetical protein